VLALHSVSVRFRVSNRIKNCFGEEGEVSPIDRRDLVFNTFIRRDALAKGLSCLFVLGRLLRTFETKTISNFSDLLMV
jgi:hypothetical protein